MERSLRFCGSAPIKAMSRGRDAPVGVFQVSVTPATPGFWGMVKSSASKEGSISVLGLIIIINSNYS